MYTGDAFKGFPDLIAEPNGGRILFATDDFFGEAERLLLRNEPEWIETKYNEFGKWMDGWETRRKRGPGHDYCLLALGLPGTVTGIAIDTAFFTGNQTPYVSIQGACLGAEHQGILAQLAPRRANHLGSAATPEECGSADALKSDTWAEVLPVTKLQPGYPDTRRHFLAPNSLIGNKRFTHLRINMFPDGGIARLRVHGQVLPDWTIVKSTDEIDLAALENGGRALSVTNAHYGHPMQLLAPGTAKGMYDGWETARNPNRPKIFTCGPDGQLIMPGFESAVIQLGHPGRISRVIIETHHFKGNYPESCILEGCLVTGAENTPSDQETWVPLVPRTKLAANDSKAFEVIATNAVSHVRLTMYPDGGISRLRVFGSIAKN